MQLHLWASFQLLCMLWKVLCMYVWVNEDSYVFPPYLHNGLISDIFYKYLWLWGRQISISFWYSHICLKNQRKEITRLFQCTCTTLQVNNWSCVLSVLLIFWSQSGYKELWVASWKVWQQGAPCTCAAFLWGLELKSSSLHLRVFSPVSLTGIKAPAFGNLILCPKTG